ncbi:MAG: hypothetical protein ACD_59C00053G0015 [uncultured bacterium]|nr:MAG: hypothetical protein ACD_59C00053G0015 [uncultured bacterium]
MTVPKNSLIQLICPGCNKSQITIVEANFCGYCGYEYSDSNSIRALNKNGIFIANLHELQAQHSDKTL